MTIAEVAQTEYTLRVIALEEKARSLPDTMPLTRRQVHWWAKIAYRAAKAEQVNPDNPPIKCGTCGGERVCDIEHHRSLIG